MQYTLHTEMHAIRIIPVGWRDTYYLRHVDSAY